MPRSLIAINRAETDPRPSQRVLFWLLVLISIAGLAMLVQGLIYLSTPSVLPRIRILAALAFVFFVMSPWAVTLPSGAKWRPAMAMVTVGMFLLPIQLTLLVAVPGLVFITARGRAPWWRYFLAFGHVGLGLVAGAAVFRLLAPQGPFELPQVIPGAILGLTIHLVVNRLISAAIVAQRTGKNVFEQIKQSFQELNWAHFDMYLMSIMTALVCQDENVWGLLLAATLQVGLFKSVSYYSRMQLWQQAAWTDGLTGVGNRVAWERFTSSLDSKKGKGMLVIIDLNNFKSVNDEFGHAVGDEVLRELAGTLQKELGKSAQVFRYGGDEFVLFFPHAAALDEEIQQRVDAIISRTNNNWSLRGLSVQASLGMASFPSDADNAQELFELADGRMYQAKMHSKIGVQS